MWPCCRPLELVEAAAEQREIAGKGYMADLRPQPTMKSWIWLVLIGIILIIPVFRRFFILWFIVFPVGWIPVFLIVIILVGVKRLRTRKKA